MSIPQVTSTARRQHVEVRHYRCCGTIPCYQHNSKPCPSPRSHPLITRPPGIGERTRDVSHTTPRLSLSHAISKAPCPPLQVVSTYLPLDRIIHCAPHVVAGRVIALMEMDGVADLKRRSITQARSHRQHAVTWLTRVAKLKRRALTYARSRVVFCAGRRGPGHSPPLHQRSRDGRRWRGGAGGERHGRVPGPGGALLLAQQDFGPAG